LKASFDPQRSIDRSTRTYARLKLSSSQKQILHLHLHLFTIARTAGHENFQGKATKLAARAGALPTPGTSRGFIGNFGAAFPALD